MSHASAPLAFAGAGKFAKGFLRGTAALRDAVVSSFNPSVDEAWLVDAQLRLHTRSTRFTLPLLVLAAFLISETCAAWVAWPVRTAWWLGVTLVCIGLDIFENHVLRPNDSSLSSVRFRARVNLGTTTLFTLAWATMCVFLWVPGVESDHVILAVILACSMAGTAAICAVHPVTAVATFAIYAVALVLPLARSPLQLDHTIAWLALVFVATMSGQLAAMSAASRRLLMFEHERTALVEDLQRAKSESDRDRARATAANRAKSQFLANMNHELRTPLNAILGFSELIKRKALGSSTDKYAEYGEIINDSGQQLLALIEDMLILARIEGGRLSLCESSVDIAALVAEAVDASQTAAANANLSLAARVGRPIPHLYADERALRQMIANLLSNAIKFTPAGGCVTVLARIEPDGRASFGVEDTGIGMSEETQATAFERFGKGRPDVTADERGTGLGLAIVKGYAEAHDGEVRLESALGSGTRVTIFLPASRVENTAALLKAAG